MYYSDYLVDQGTAADKSYDYEKYDIGAGILEYRYYVDNKTAYVYFESFDEYKYASYESPKKINIKPSESLAFTVKEINEAGESVFSYELRASTWEATRGIVTREDEITRDIVTRDIVTQDKYIQRELGDIKIDEYISSDIAIIGVIAVIITVLIYYKYTKKS